MSKERPEPSEVTSTQFEARWDVDGDLKVTSTGSDSGLVAIGECYDDSNMVQISKHGLPAVIAALKAARDWSGE